MTRKVRFDVEVLLGTAEHSVFLRRDIRDRAICVSACHNGCIYTGWVDTVDLLRRMGATPLELRSIARRFEQQDKKAKQLARSLRDKKRKDG